MLVFVWDFVIHENEGDHKQIVNAQGKFNEVPRQVLDDALTGTHLIDVVHEIVREAPIHNAGEAQGIEHKKQGFPQCFARRIDVFDAVKHSKVEYEEDAQMRKKQDPGKPMVHGVR